MPSLLDLIDEQPKDRRKAASSQPSLKEFLVSKPHGGGGEERERSSASDKGKLMSLLLKGGREGGDAVTTSSGASSSWKENSVSNAEIILTNRMKNQEARTGWRVLADGTKTYSTYRGGKLVTGEGGQAFSLSMGDSKGKRGRGVKRKEDTVNAPGAGKSKGKGAVSCAKIPRVNSSNGDSKLRKETEGRRAEQELSRRSPPQPILPESYTGAISSADTATDWGF